MVCLVRRAGSVLVGLVGLVGLVMPVACAGQSQSPPEPPQQLPCEATLTQNCCGTGKECIGDLASAERCSNWPAGARVLVYPSSCSGYAAVAVKLQGNDFSQYYVYAGATLVAIADDAQVNTQGSAEIECGAGPNGFTLPGACGVAWLDTTKGEACAAGTSTPASVCQ